VRTNHFFSYKRGLFFVLLLYFWTFPDFSFFVCSSTIKYNVTWHPRAPSLLSSNRQRRRSHPPTSRPAPPPPPTAANADRDRCRRRQHRPRPPHPGPSLLTPGTPSALPAAAAADQRPRPCRRRRPRQPPPPSRALLRVGAAADQGLVAGRLRRRRTPASLPAQSPSAVPGPATTYKKHRQGRGPG